MKINKYLPPPRWLFLCVLFIPRIKKWYQRKLFGFAIGEPLELNEFKLEVLETILVNEIELEVYQYLMDKPFWLLGNRVKEIKLYYNADVLMRIDYLFQDVVILDRNLLMYLKCSRVNFCSDEDLLIVN